MLTSSEKIPTRTVHGDRPSHRHTCQASDRPDDLHEWECNSPYCTDVISVCPDHGGPTPIIQGHEFWRGR